MAIGWTFYKMGSVPNFFNGWNLFLKYSINEHRFESFYAHFILFLLCCVIYFPLLTWHFQSSLNLISILSASDVCECCIVLYRNPFCLMAIRCPSDEKYFWCEGAITRQCHSAIIRLCVQGNSATGRTRSIRTRLIQTWSLNTKFLGVLFGTLLSFHV